MRKESEEAARVLLRMFIILMAGKVLRKMFEGMVIRGINGTETNYRIRIIHLDV